MEFEGVRVGPVHPRYTTRGNISSFSVEIWHDGLGEHREIKSSEIDVLESRVHAALLKWDQKWSARKVQSQRQQSADSADAETAEAQAALIECERILLAALSVDDRLDWEKLKSFEPFIWSADKRQELNYERKSNRPSSIKKVRVAPAPEASLFKPELSWYHFFLAKKRQQKIREGEEKYQLAVDAHRAVMAECVEEEARRSQLLELEVSKYENARLDFFESQSLANAKVDEFRVAWRRKDQNAVMEHAALVLESSSYPEWVDTDFDVSVDIENGVMVVDFRLPSPSEIPSIERVSFVKSRSERVVKNISDARAKKMYESICYQMAIRTLHELFEADEVDAILSLTFNGWVESVNPATGLEGRSCILSVQADKGEFLAFKLGSVDPKSCFKQLKGVAASALVGLSPVRPILQLQTNDSRFVSAREVASSLDDSVNLAAMPWDEFEHLIRELFSKVFSQPGAEVHVTQASRDGGVDAIALDPDPIKGGKIVIQAKRYTNTVGVSAVRDLYGTVMNEGANRGILVTTSSYGPDAYKFAQGKPLTLLNGANLLSLLSDHGHRAKIDIKAARDREL